MLPSIDSLRCFLAAARLLNFRAGARSVALTPTAFSQRIRLLEEHLGTPLFLRNTRSVRLTQSGEALVPVAQRCIAAAEDCVRAARGERSGAPIDFTIGTRHELGISWLLPAFAALEPSFPWLSFQLHFGSSDDILHRVATMQIDCAITSSRLTDTRLDALTLHREDYVFVGAKKLLAKTPFAKVADAEHHTLLDINANLPLFRYLQDTLAGDVSVRFGRVVGLGTGEAIRARVLAGAGVAVLPKYFVESDIAAKRLVKLLPSKAPLHDYFRLVFRKDDPRQGLFEALAKVLRGRPLR